MRTRTTTSAMSSPVVYEQYFPISCSNRTASSVGAYPAAAYLGEYKTITDVVTPNWRKKKGKKFVINPYSVFTQKIEVVGSSDLTLTTVANACTNPAIKGWTHDYGHHFTCFLAPTAPPSGGTPLSAERVQSLAKEVWTRCMSQRQSGNANFMESLAELDRTWDMLSRPMQSAIRLIDHLRRQGKRVRRNRRNTSITYSRSNVRSEEFAVFTFDEWLRFRYGISPLINDAKAIMKALRTQYDQKPEVHRSLSTGQLDGSDFVTGILTSTHYDINYQRITRHSVKMRAFFYDRYRQDPFQTLGLTFHNLVGVPYELMRYSFVLDWFVNLGDLIYANAPRVGIESIGGGLTQIDERTSVWSPTSTVSKGSVYTLTGGASDQLKVTTRSQARHPGITLSTGIVIKNDFRFDGFTRAADAASLLMQRLLSISFERKR